MIIKVYINTNHIYEETRIEEMAIHEFTTTGFVEGTYDAEVAFSCMPAAIDANALTVVIESFKDASEYVETISVYVKVCKAIYKFLKKCHGYSKSIEVDGADSVPDIVQVSDDMTEEEFEAKVLAILELERKHIGKDVAQIIEDN